MTNLEDIKIEVDEDNGWCQSFEQFIKCSCKYCGGVLVDGIEIDYDYTETCSKRYPPTASVHFSFVKKRDMHHVECWSFWQRLKLAWKVLRNKFDDFYLDDIILEREGMQKLRDTCDLALSHWPTREQLDRPRPTLAELYAQLEAEEELTIQEETNG